VKRANDCTKIVYGKSVYKSSNNFSNISKLYQKLKMVKSAVTAQCSFTGTKE